MARKPAVLVNVPPLAEGEASTEAELEAMRRTMQGAAKELHAKIAEDRRRREALIDGITDKSMRESLKRR